jgi:ABC-2 type transport system permease protein
LPQGDRIEKHGSQPYDNSDMGRAESLAISPMTPTLAPPQRAVSWPGVWLPALSLCRRELVRFLRQRHRIVGALGTPIVFWLLLGLGMGTSFRGIGVPGGESYLKFFFPGTLLMILLFTAIFSTISIIEDRREGFLQSVLVAPVSRMSIVLGKILGGTMLAFVQGIIFLALAPLVGLHLSAAGFVEGAAMMFVVAFALTGLGFCIAWRMSSTQGFHAIMNLFLMPLWFLSGALFTPQTAWGGLKWVMRVNPLSYGLAGLQRSVFGHVPAAAALPGWGIIVGVSVAFAAAMFALSSVVAGGRVAADLQ